jgi:hypothetical protein
LAEEKKCGQLQAMKKPDRKCMIQLDEHQKYLIRKTITAYMYKIKPFPFLLQDTWLLLMIVV